MVLKPGKSGLGGPDDFEVVSGSDDDGEKYAGGRVLKVIQAESVIDAVVANEGGVDAEMVDVFEEFVDIEEPVEAPADAEDAISIFGDDEPVEY